MSNAVPEMIDVVFALSGRSLPTAYAHALWRETVRVLPWLETQKYAGILPLRMAADTGGVLLPHRAKLVLRVPVGFLKQALQMSGQELNVGGHVLSVGAARERPLQAHSTLHAHLVASARAEEAFLGDVAAELREMGVTCQWICGKRMSVAGARPIQGFSLVLHELKPQDSLRVQCMGLGGERRYGCGIFVPYKAIPNLS
jgi:CRISPR-associated protein Cas6